MIEKIKPGSKGPADTSIHVYCSNSKVHKSLENASTDSYYPPEHRDTKHALGTSGALFHTIKGSLGSGIFSMPLAFKHGGLWASLVGTLFVGLINTHCMYILVNASQMLSRRVRQPSLSYGATAEAAFMYGPMALRKYSFFVREFVEIALATTYYSGLGVYVIFIVTTLKQVIEAHYAINLSLQIYVLLLSVILIPIGSIRQLKYLVPLSFSSIIFLMLGCTFVLYDVFSDLPPLSSTEAFTNIPKLSMFYSTALFALAGIGTVLPIENAMNKPQGFLGLFGVLNSAMSLLTVMYTFMGFFGYLRYGNTTQGSVTLNLGNTMSGDTVKVLVAVNVLCSYALCIFVPCEIVWSKVCPKVPANYSSAAYYVLRVLLVIGTLCLAASLSDLELFVGLIGTVFFSTLCLMFPAIIDIIAFWGDWGTFHWRLYKNLFLVLLWIVVLIAGTKASVSKISEAYYS